MPPEVGSKWIQKTDVFGSSRRIAIVTDFAADIVRYRLISSDHRSPKSRTLAEFLKMYEEFQ